MRLPYPHPTSKAITAVMKGNRKTSSGPEVALRSALHRLGLRFRKNYALRIGGRLIRPDVVFVRARVAVFVDGCFWHRCPEHGTSPRANTAYWGPKLDRNVQRDREIDTALRAAGWTPVRIWEHVAAEDGARVVLGELSDSASSELVGVAHEVRPNQTGSQEIPESDRHALTSSD